MVEAKEVPVMKKETVHLYLPVRISLEVRVWPVRVLSSINISAGAAKGDHWAFIHFRLIRGSCHLIDNINVYLSFTISIVHKQPYTIIIHQFLDLIE